MYKVYYRSRFDSNDEQVLHDLETTQTLVEGTITQSLDKIPTFEFNISMDNDLYDVLDPINGIVRVVNGMDNEIEFEGRILQPTASMNRNGFTKSFVCEGYLSYLHDSAQTYAKFGNNGVKGYLTRVISEHNKQVEPHKQIKVGNVTVSDTDNYPHSYIDYESTFDTLRSFLKERFGGVFVMRNTPSGLVLDYLKIEDAGDHGKSPIALGQNIKTARRNVNFDQLITRLVPVGNTVEGQKQDESTPDGQKTTSERITIASVNGGRNYLEDSDLIRHFGIRQKIVMFDHTKTASELLRKAREFMKRQEIAMASWDIETVEMYLIDKNFDKYKIGNFHPIINPPISGIEELQIVEKQIRFSQPQSVRLTIGSQIQTFSSYQAHSRKSSEAYKNFMGR
ncbi:phage tail protein [Aerococcaceae bacterium DSM 111020]|nr:phage tail protein [Aerococcaceae bacterium DSM 111020]